MKNLCFLILLNLCATFVFSQSSGVRFANIDLTAAKQRAAIEDKLIFIDTYATYCKACKKLEREFKNPKLSKFFNQNFINVRIDMDSKAGSEIKNKYQVVFLPTILIIDQLGNQKFKLDRLVSADELLSIAKFYQEKSYPGTTPVQTQRRTVAKTQPAAKPKVKKEVITETKPMPSQPKIVSTPSKPAEPVADKNEKILYVFRQEGEQDLPPPILKQEAYFRMQLMDGSHIQTARKYLKTQTDWSTKENIRFLFDFLYTVNSKEFNFLIDNQSKFAEVIGADQVAATIKILVNKELERAHPKPNLKRAQELIALSNPVEAEHLAREYHMQSLLDEGNKTEFLKLGRTHLEQGCDNHKLLNDLASVMLEMSSSKKQTKECLAVSKKALLLSPDNISYLLTCGKIQYKLGQKENALASVNNALLLAKKGNQSTVQIETLLKSIQEL